jgi:hypothetical protein
MNGHPCLSAYNHPYEDDFDDHLSLSAYKQIPHASVVAYYGGGACWSESGEMKNWSLRNSPHKG